MPVRVLLPASLRQLAESKKAVMVEGTTVSEVLQNLGALYPKLSASLPTNGPKRFIQIFVNEEDIRGLDGIDTKLGPGDVVELLSAVSGG